MFQRKLRNRLTEIEARNRTNWGEVQNQKALVQRLERALRDAVLIIKSRNPDHPMEFFDGGECENLEKQLLARHSLKRDFSGKLTHQEGWIVARPDPYDPTRYVFYWSTGETDDEPVMKVVDFDTI